MRGNLSCPDCGKKSSIKLLHFLKSIERAMRKALKNPDYELYANSTMRCKKHNKKVGGSKTSEHLDSDAGDIKTRNSRERYALVKILFRLNIKRIGIYKTFTHMGLSYTHPQLVMWLKR